MVSVMLALLVMIPPGPSAPAPRAVRELPGVRPAEPPHLHAMYAL